MSQSRDSGPLTPVVHARGDMSRLDAVLDLVQFVARPCPLATALDELPRRIAALFPCDVCSIYFLEGDELVMRGNVGFPAKALGAVRLPVGTGITGMAVEVMRPISLDAASSHASNHPFPGLGEERFPIFMAVPVAGPRGPLGALVLRRRERPSFGPAELELAAALTAPIATLVERAHVGAALRRRPGRRGRRPLAATRVTLPGRPLRAGCAVGPLYVAPRPAARGSEEPRTPAAVQIALQQVLTQTRRSLEGLERRGQELGVDVAFLRTYRVILDDARLQGRILEHARAGAGLAGALARAGAEASRSLGDDAFGSARGRAIDDLCEAMAMLASDSADEAPRSAVLVGEQMTLFDLLVSARCQPVGLVLSSTAGELAASLLPLLGVPAVAEVAGIFRWASEGELVLVDGDHGLVRINPGRAELAAARAQRKERKLQPTQT